MRRFQLIHLFPIFCVFFLSACNDSITSDNEKLNIVVTTGMIQDAVENIVGTKANVTALLGPNSDPHMAQASKGDLKRIQNADLIIKNGLHLEGKLGDALDQFSSKTPVFNLSDGINPEDLMLVDYSTVHDPHIWFNVDIWKQGVAYIARKIIENDSSNKEYYIKNTTLYTSKLDTLHSELVRAFNAIDTNKRILITAHDAFRYFGEAYDIDVIGIQGVSTLSQTSIKKRTSLSDFIIQHKIGAIFPEASVRDNQVNAIIEDCEAKGYHVNIGVTLYSDALGEQNTPAGNYIGMVRYNMKQILKAMQ